MKIIKILKLKYLLIILLLNISCKKESNNQPGTAAEEIPVENSVSKNKEQNASFVVSCGSGCAMTYYEDNVIILETSREVKFKVEMYIDEVLNDTYFETYIFKCNEEKVSVINLKGKNDNLLESNLPEIRNNFEEYGNMLCSKYKSNNGIKTSENCLKESNFKLPFNQKINNKTITYHKLECKTISGVDKFLCDEASLRYISLPDYKDVNVILVPMDYGDFNYRYYLLTIFNNNVISSEFVEGEWYEPEDDTYKEFTSFTINENYNIKIKTEIIENGNLSLKEEINFKISDTGKLEKIK
ncbi:hypothetical protein [Flavobacterium piscis]|uniref:Lipoprotein n=1 Tax=Flavobacterium piscis TaxID=1114874 RepID=A0ABU1YB50_9FLAO|nr:hypothetical protein [Flavobacterium piscis]MDR7211463.1 hypothetical protein [Flavobacterium piscis]